MGSVLKKGDNVDIDGYQFIAGNDVFFGSVFMPKSLFVAITVAKVAFCRIC